MNNFDALINKDETMFSRLTKTSRSWSQKGREMNLMNTAKAVYAGDFQLVFELCQLLESINMNSWHSSKTS